MLIPIALTVMLILIRGGGSFRFCPDGSKYHSRSKCNWPDGVLKYEITSSFNQEEGEIIRKAVSDLETKLKGCITFEETNRGRRVEITNNGFSFISKRGLTGSEASRLDSELNCSLTIS